MHNKSENKNAGKSIIWHIRHFIGKFLLTLFVIFLILIGFSQTHTFRTILKNFVLELAKDEINGSLNIGSIEGSFISGIQLNDVSYKLEGVTLLKTKKIHTSFSLISLINKRITVNDVTLEDAEINIVKFQDSLWIFNKILKKIKPPDTTEAAPFDYTVILRELKLQNCTIRLKNFTNKNIDKSDKIYPLLNFSDLLIDKLNLKISSIFSLKNKRFRIKFSEFNFKSNAKDFNLKDFSFTTSILKDRVDISNFNLVTQRTKLRLKLLVKDLDLFSGINIEEFKDKIINLELLANNFNFGDLETLLPIVNMLKGEVGFELKANEKFGELNISKLNINVANSNLKLTGKINNLHKPENLFLDTKIFESTFEGKDIVALLPLYKLDFLTEIGKINFEKIDLVGEPLNFKSDIAVQSEYGRIEGLVDFNFKTNLAKYNVRILTHDFNLKKITKIESRLNCDMNFSGEGFSPENLNTIGSIRILKSKLAQFDIDSSLISFSGKNSFITLDMKGVTDALLFKLKSDLNLTQKEFPKYNLNLDISKLDIEKALNSKYNYSDLNLSLVVEGENFELDKIKSKGSLQLKDSYLKGKKLNPVNLTFALDSSAIGKNLIINSEIFDLDIKGKYSFSKLIKVIPEQIDEVITTITKKVDAFTKAIPFSDTTSTSTTTTTLHPSSYTFFPDNNFELEYMLKLKDLSLVNIIMENLQLSTELDVSGKVINTEDKFSFTLANRTKYFWIVQDSTSTFLNGGNLKLDLTNTKLIDSKNRLDLVMNLDLAELRNSVLIQNLTTKIKLNPDSASFRMISEIDSMIKIRTDGFLDISKSIYEVRLNQATIEYLKYKITNEGPLVFSFNRNGLSFNEFNLRRKKERINIFGTVGLSGEQDLMITANKISISEIIQNFVTDYNSQVDGLVTFNLKLRGNAGSPKIESVLMLDSLVINQAQLGTFIAQAQYSDEVFQAEMNYADAVYTGKDLNIYGSIPINLSYVYKGERLKKNDSITVDIKFENFNISPVGAFLYDVKQLAGQINGDIKIRGSINNPNLSGNAKIDSSHFLLAFNNLRYKLKSSLSFTENEIIIKELETANYDQGSNSGKIITTGNIKLNNMELSEIDLISKGSLLVLANGSATASEMVSGDLVIGTKEPIHLTGNSDQVLLQGTAEIKKANLIIPLPESQYQTNEETFKYVFKQNNVNNEIDSAKMVTDSLFKLRNVARVKTEQEKISKSIFSNFVSQLKISLSDEVSVTFLINKELNQRLYTELKGNLIFILMNGKAAFQGEIQVAQDSYLTFYQKFKASGSLRFESEISNPSLNILAEYSNYYVGTDTTGGDVKDVIIKIKLVGTVKELAKNMIKNADNIQVYINNTLDNTKDASDAVAFIVIGKFKNDLTAQDKSNISGSFGNTVKGAATSILGTLVSSFANSVLGDVIKSVDLQQVGEQTKFSLSGRVEKLRFKFGGSTNNIQNLGAAELQLEYPLFEKLFLRLERKNAALRSTGTDIEMINELGIKYKYEF